MRKRLGRLLHPENHCVVPNSPTDNHTKTLLARLHRFWVEGYQDHKYSETAARKPSAQRLAGQVRYRLPKLCEFAGPARSDLSLVALHFET